MGRDRQWQLSQLRPPRGARGARARVLRTSAQAQAQAQAQVTGTGTSASPASATKTAARSPTAPRWAVAAGSTLRMPRRWLAGSGAPASKKAKQCCVCLEDRDATLFATLPCEHSDCCLACVREYVRASVEDDGKSVVACPSATCTAVIGDAALARLRLMPSALTWAALQRSRRTLLAAQDADVHVCPAPDCGFLFVEKLPEKAREEVAEGTGTEEAEGAKEATGTELTCADCSATHCERCKASPFHAQMSCAEHRAQLLSDEQALLVLALPDVRMCQGCGNAVQRRAGCMKMQCRCGFVFCFGCSSASANCKCTSSKHRHFNNAGTLSSLVNTL